MVSAFLHVNRVNAFFSNLLLSLEVLFFSGSVFFTFLPNLKLKCRGIISACFFAKMSKIYKN